MNIVLHFLGLRAGGGRTDAINLLKVLPTISSDDFLAIVPRGCGYENISLPPNCQLHFEAVRRFNDVWRLYFDNYRLKNLCKQFNADVLFTMCNNGPLKIGTCRHVIMLRRSQFVYSTIELNGAKIQTSFKLNFLKWYFQQSLKYADALIVQTNTIKDRVKQKYHIDCPVEVVGKAVSQEIRTSEDQDAVSEQPKAIKNHPAKFKCLYLSKYYPHKNIEMACQAVAECRKNGCNVALFLTLNPGESLDGDKLIERVNNGSYGDSVANVGHVDLVDIASVYEECDAVLIPSLLESYSATYLEGMKYGKPIVASDRDFARDVCGAAAFYVDPLNIDSMVSAIGRLAEDSSMKSSLAQEGFVRYDDYTKAWDDIALQYLEIIKG